MLGLTGPGARGQQLKGGTVRGCSGRRPAVLHVAGKGWKGREVVEKNRGSRPPASVAALRQSPIFLLSLNRAIDFCNALIFIFDIVGSDNAGRKMEPWIIDMLGSNAGGSHDLNMIGRNAGGSHDLEFAETQYASPQEEQVCREAVPVEASTAVKGNKKRSKNFSVQEDNLLVAAWLEISMDAVQGIN